MSKPKAGWWTVEEMYRKTSLCPGCSGSGLVKEKRCRRCGGVGRIDNIVRAMLK